MVSNHSKGMLGSGGNSDSSSKKMGLFNNSGSAFMDGRNWCGISPVCSRMRDHINLGPGGIPIIPHKGGRLFLDQSPQTATLPSEMQRADSTITVAWPMQSPPMQDTAKGGQFSFYQHNRGGIAQSTGCSQNKGYLMTGGSAANCGSVYGFSENKGSGANVSHNKPAPGTN